MCRTGTEHKVFQYMVNHGDSWISGESILESNSTMLSSYLFSQENVREVIKIEEMDSTSGDGGCCSSSVADDSKEIYNFYGKEYKARNSEISSTLCPSKTHERPHETEKPYKCDTCGQQFTLKIYLKQHQTVHTGEKVFTCDECGKQFSRIGNLKRHQLIHTGEIFFKCDECGKQFSDRCYLKLRKH